VGTSIARCSSTASLEAALGLEAAPLLVSAAGAQLTSLEASAMPETPAELLLDGERGPPIGVIGALAGIAETGSVLVLHEDVREVWLVGLSEHLVVTVAEATIVDTLDDCVDLLESLGRESKSWTLLTGPSRTADIERTLTIGVQGCIEMTVAVMS
jgi:L-lactate dehydrogenase complex protein LldG